LSNESGAVLTEQEEATERDSSAAMTMEDYLHYESEAFKTPNHGDIVDGIVVRVDAIKVKIGVPAERAGGGNRGTELAYVTVVARSQQSLLVCSETVCDTNTRADAIPLQRPPVPREIQVRERC
jgi:hypothetical protein